MDDLIFAKPPSAVIPYEQCIWYHRMDLPGIGETPGAWDLRAGMDDYLGHVDVRGERVLEVGPATGQITVELERRGAHVVAVDITSERGWDFVPQVGIDGESLLAERRNHLQAIKDTFWFVHKATGSEAKIYYGDVEALPEALGGFDTFFLLAILLHSRCPAAILEGAARATSKRVVVTELSYPDLGDEPIVRLQPSAENRVWDTWWRFSPRFIQNFLGILGFSKSSVFFHSQPNFHIQTNIGVEFPFFTVVAERERERESKRAHNRSVLAATTVTWYELELETAPIRKSGNRHTATAVISRCAFIT